MFVTICCSMGCVCVFFSADADSSALDELEFKEILARIAVYYMPTSVSFPTLSIPSLFSFLSDSL